MTHAPPLVVAGLPWSGASIAAEALHAAGLPLGGPFLAPEPRDLVGAFVDREILAWNARWRSAANADAPAEAIASALAELEPLLAARFADAPAWGVRAPLALETLALWERRFPDARWLVAVRAPDVWAAARVARADPLDLRSPLGRAREALRTWRLAARRTLELARRAPESVQLVDPARSAGGDAPLDARLRSDWRLPVAPVSVGRAFRPFLLRRRAPGWLRLLVAFDPASRRLWRRIEERLAPASRPAARPGPRTLVVANLRFAPSESFIQEQLRRLPGEVHFVFRRDDAWRDRDDLPLASLGARVGAAVGRELGLDVSGIQRRSLVRHLRRHRIEVVLANFGRLAVDALPACRTAGVPLVAHFHGADAHRERPAPGSAAFYAPVFGEAAAIVAVSRPMIERLAELGAPRDRIRLNPCGVDLGEFPPRDPAAAPPRFVAAGRFVGKKAPYLTLLAFARAAAAAPEARLDFLGEGELREPCRLLAVALGVADRVDFPGAFAHGELAERLRGARAFLQHSIRQPDGDSEGTPVALLEAAASGLPVISTRHAGIPQAVVDGDTGFLVDEGDVAAMADAIVRLAADPRLAAELGARGRRHVGERYALDRRVARLGEILADAAAGRRSPEVDDVAVSAEPLGEQPAPLALRRGERLAQ